MTSDLDSLLSSALRQRDASRISDALRRPRPGSPSLPIPAMNWRETAYVKLHYQYLCSRCGSDTIVLEGTFIERQLVSHPTTTRLTRIHNPAGPDLPLHRRNTIVPVTECANCED